jgi:hypothetical protein
MLCCPFGKAVPFWDVRGAGLRIRGQSAETVCNVVRVSAIAAHEELSGSGWLAPIVLGALGAELLRLNDT